MSLVPSAPLLAIMQHISPQNPGQTMPGLHLILERDDRDSMFENLSWPMTQKRIHPLPTSLTLTNGEVRQRRLWGRKARLICGKDRDIRNYTVNLVPSLGEISEFSAIKKKKKNPT